MFARLQKFIIPLILLVIFVACSWTLFNPQMFFTHDYVHGARIAEMARALADGHFPVRWSENFAYGYGMPLFEFYAPFPFYIGGLLYLAGLPLVFTVKTLFALVSIGTVIGSYLLGKKISDSPWGGVLLSAVITLAPYRALNLFIRGAVSETWGMLGVIWIILSTIWVLEQKKYSWLVLLISLNVLFLSHNLVTIIALPFIALWTLVLLYSKYADSFKHRSAGAFSQLRKTIVVVCATYALAIGTAAFYVVPAFPEKDFTLVEQKTTGGYFDYSLHFLYIRQLFRPGWGYGGSEWGPDDKLSFFLGFSQYALLLVSGLVFAYQLVLKKKRSSTFSHVKLPFIVSMFLFSFALFMTIGKSKLIWDALPFLKFVQFPWRYFTLATIFGGIAVMYALKLMNRKMMASVVVGGVLLAVGINSFYFKPEKFIDVTENLYYADARKISEKMSSVLPDYIPKGVSDPSIPPTQFVTCGTSVCENLEIREDKVHKKVVVLDAREAESVTFSIANYPGWTVLIDGEKTDHKTSPLGLIQTPVLGAGKHTLEVYFGSTPIRRIADTISSAALVIVGAWILYERTKKRKA